MMTKQMTKPSMDDLPRYSSTLPPPPAAKTWGRGGDRVLGSIYFSFLKPRANGRNIVGQQLPILLDVTCFSFCAPCCMLLRVIGTCCAKFETGQTFRYVQTDATRPSRGKYLDPDSQTDLHTIDKRIRSLS